MPKCEECAKDIPEEDFSPLCPLCDYCLEISLLDEGLKDS